MLRHTTDAHIVRAKAMLQMEQDELKNVEIPHLSHAKIDRKEAPVFTKPLGAVTVKEGQSAKYVGMLTKCLQYISFTFVLSAIWGIRNKTLLITHVEYVTVYTCCM